VSKQLQFSTKFEQVLYGSLLGDGCLPNDINSRNARFSEKHNVRQKDYLLWKKDILEERIKFGKISYDKRRDIIGIRSHSNPLLTLTRNIFYPNGRKVIRKNILEKLSLLGLAMRRL